MAKHAILGKYLPSSSIQLTQSLLYLVHGAHFDLQMDIPPHREEKHESIASFELDNTPFEGRLGQCLLIFIVRIGCYPGLLLCAPLKVDEVTDDYVDADTIVEGISVALVLQQLQYQSRTDQLIFLLEHLVEMHHDEVPRNEYLLAVLCEFSQVLLELVITNINVQFIFCNIITTIALSRVLLEDLCYRLVQVTEWMLIVQDTSRDTHVPECLVVLVVHAFLFARLPDQIKFEVAAQHHLWKENEFLFIV